MKSLQIRKTEVEQRNAARAKRSDEQQLKLLAARPGASTRERARLEARITAAKAKKSASPTVKQSVAPEAPAAIKRKSKAKKVA